MDQSTVIGDLERFAFQIAPPDDESRGKIRTVDIFIGGTRITTFDNTAYVPAFVARLEETSNWLQTKIDYVQFVDEFGDKNVAQIHEFLSNENGPIADAHRFMSWGETTDYIRSFLIPYCGQLHLTFQIADPSKPDDEHTAYVDGVPVTPYALIVTIDQAAKHLRAALSPPT